MNKYAVYTGIFILFIMLLAYLYFGSKFLKSVMNYPFVRNSEDFTFSGPSNTEGNIKQFQKTTNFNFKHETQIQNIKVDFDTNITGIPLYLRIYVTNEQANFITDRGENILIPGSGTENDAKTSWHYSQTIPLQPMAPMVPYNALKYVKWDLMAWAPGGNGQILISSDSLQNTVTVNGTQYPVTIKVNLIEFTFVNSSISKEEKMLDKIGILFIGIFSAIGYYYFGKFLRENITVGANKFGFGWLNKLASLAPLIIMGGLFLLGISFGGLMIAGHHLTEPMEMILNFWSLASYLMGIYGFYVLMY